MGWEVVGDTLTQIGLAGIQNEFYDRRRQKELEDADKRRKQQITEKEAAERKKADELYNALKPRLGDEGARAVAYGGLSVNEWLATKEQDDPYQQWLSALPEAELAKVYRIRSGLAPKAQAPKPSKPSYDKIIMPDGNEAYHPKGEPLPKGARFYTAGGRGDKPSYDKIIMPDGSEAYHPKGEPLPRGARFYTAGGRGDKEDRGFTRSEALALAKSEISDLEMNERERRGYIERRMATLGYNSDGKRAPEGAMDRARAYIAALNRYMNDETPGLARDPNLPARAQPSTAGGRGSSPENPIDVASPEEASKQPPGTWIRLPNGEVGQT
jgi:hypothetical protein